MSPKPIDGQTVAVALMLLSPGATVVDPNLHAAPPAVHSQQAYGNQLMSAQERRAYQAKLQGLSTPSEREVFLQQHRRKMQLRASSQGIGLPTEISPPGPLR